MLFAAATFQMLRQVRPDFDFLILQSWKQLYQSAQSTNHWSGFKMKHDNSLASWQKLVVAAGLGTLGSVLVITTSFARSSVNCRAYAEDCSLRYSAPWATLNFNIGGRRAGVSALAAHRSRALKQSTLFDNAYARCMRGRWP